MKPFVVFTTPGDAHVELRHDAGRIFHATPGTADGRPAHLLAIDGVPDGYGARLMVTREGFVPVEHRGTLWLTRPGPRAEFAVDDIYLTPTADSEPDRGELPRVVVVGTHFMTEDGKPWTWKGCSDFMLYQRFLAGEDIRPILEQRRALGANLLRVFGMLHFIERFYPQEQGGYYESLPTFARLLAEHRLYVEFVAFADQQVIRVPEQAHFTDCCTQLRGQSNVFIELCNEYPKNGIDPRHFSKPQGLLASAGSALADQPPAVFWDFFGWHGRRDWPKVTSSAEDMWYVIQRQQIPGVHDEPARRDRPAQYDRYLARQLGASALVLGAGATFHSPEGLRSEPFSALTSDEAWMFFEALS